MRVLLVSQYFWPENFRINDLARELVERGHHVTVLTGKPNYPSGKVFAEFKSAPNAFGDYFGASVCRVPMLARGTGGLRLMLNYLSFVVGASVFAPVRLLGKRFDVVFVFEPSPITVGLPAILLGKLKHAPVILWVQDLWPDTLVAVNAVTSHRLLAAVGSMVRFIYKRCVLVLGQSHGFLDRIAAYCDDTAKIRYFPNWAEDAPATADVTPAPEIPLKGDTFDILFAGNIGEAQDFPAILDAIELLKSRAEIRWIIVGDGRRSDWLRIEIARRGLDQCVLMLGWFPLDRMPSFYARADALLVSLRADPVFALTVPSKVQSYLMGGVPVLGMLDGEGAEVIRKAKAGLTCAAGDSAGLAKAVLELSAMPRAQRMCLGENGRRYAESEFGRSVLTDRLEGWLADIVQRQVLSQRRIDRR
ncbi:MAG: glycosyltransferase family 4 protein [Gallionella sp.]|nr:glycosyltransferase family 4 protein [Gallionella sp.]